MNVNYQQNNNNDNNNNNNNSNNLSGFNSNDNNSNLKLYRSISISNKNTSSEKTKFNSPDDKKTEDKSDKSENTNKTHKTTSQDKHKTSSAHSNKNCSNDSISEDRSLSPNSKKKKPFVERIGDWVCLKCRNLNFSFRITCNRCQLSKIESERLFEQYMKTSSETQPGDYDMAETLRKGISVGVK